MPNLKSNIRENSWRFEPFTMIPGDLDHSRRSQSRHLQFEPFATILKLSPLIRTIRDDPKVIIAVQRPFASLCRCLYSESIRFFFFFFAFLSLYFFFSFWALGPFNSCLLRMGIFIFVENGINQTKRNDSNTLMFVLLWYGSLSWPLFVVFV